MGQKLRTRSGRFSIAGLAALLAAACGSLPPRAPMSDGQRLYLAKCTSCHDAYEPHDYTPRQWRNAIREMEADKRIHLAQADRSAILIYLTGSPLASEPAPEP